MSARDPESQQEASKPGDTARRIVVFLFGTCSAVVCVAAVLEDEFGFAVLFGAPALVFFGIAGWGGRRSVGAAKAVTDITNLIP